MAKAKRKQEANDQKLNKDYKNFVKASQKRSVDIQSPEVRARMKHNKKENAVRDKAKKKKIRSGSKTAGKKYK
jgi:hypothetical protein